MHTTVKIQQKIVENSSEMTKGRLWKEVILTKIANVAKMVNDSAFHNLNFHQYANFCQIYLFPQICQFHQICPFLRTKPVQTLEHLNDTWSDLYVHCMYMYYPEQSMQSTNSRYINVSVLGRLPSEKGVGWITSISLLFLTHHTFYSCPKWLQIFKQISTLINFQASWLQQTTNNIITVSSEDNKIMYTKKKMLNCDRTL